MHEVRTRECRRCGACCLPGIFSLMKDEDLCRWKEEGRDDILRIIGHTEPVWAGDHMISSGGGDIGRGCVFLYVEKGVAACSIYETRPLVCRDFVPASSMICPLWEKDDSQGPATR